VRVATVATVMGRVYRGPFGLSSPNRAASSRRLPAGAGEGPTAVRGRAGEPEPRRRRPRPGRLGGTEAARGRSESTATPSPRRRESSCARHRAAGHATLRPRAQGDVTGGLTRRPRRAKGSFGPAVDRDRAGHGELGHDPTNVHRSPRARRRADVDAPGLAAPAAAQSRRRLSAPPGPRTGCRLGVPEAPWPYQSASVTRPPIAYNGPSG
jgi:hypothetical protein